MPNDIMSYIIMQNGVKPSYCLECKAVIAFIVSLCNFDCSGKSKSSIELCIRYKHKFKVHIAKIPTIFCPESSATKSKIGDPITKWTIPLQRYAIQVTISTEWLPSSSTPSGKLQQIGHQNYLLTLCGNLRATTGSNGRRAFLSRRRDIVMSISRVRSFGVHGVVDFDQRCSMFVEMLLLLILGCAKKKVDVIARCLSTCSHMNQCGC